MKVKDTLQFDENTNTVKMLYSGDDKELSCKQTVYIVVKSIQKNNPTIHPKVFDAMFSNIDGAVEALDDYYPGIFLENLPMTSAVVALVDVFNYALHMPIIISCISSDKVSVGKELATVLKEISSFKEKVSNDISDKWLPDIDKAILAVENNLKSLIGEPERSDSLENKQKIPVEELKALKNLYDAGILTQEEFEKKKKLLLGI